MTKASRDLPGLGLFFLCCIGHGLLHMALHRVRRLAHSLKWNIGLGAANRKLDSPNVDDITYDRPNLHQCYIGFPQRRIPLAIVGVQHISSARFVAVGRYFANRRSTGAR